MRVSAGEHRAQRPDPLKREYSGTVAFGSLWHRWLLTKGDRAGPGARVGAGGGRAAEHSGAYTELFTQHLG